MKCSEGVTGKRGDGERGRWNIRHQDTDRGRQTDIRCRGGREREEMKKSGVTGGMGRDREEKEKLRTA